MKNISRKSKKKKIILIILLILILMLVISFVASIIVGLQEPAILPEKIDLSLEEVIF